MPRFGRGLLARLLSRWCYDFRQESWRVWLFIFMISSRDDYTLGPLIHQKQQHSVILFFSLFFKFINWKIIYREKPHFIGCWNTQKSRCIGKRNSLNSSPLLIRFQNSELIPEPYPNVSSVDFSSCEHYYGTHRLKHIKYVSVHCSFQPC